jgi:transposase-like protein
MGEVTLATPRDRLGPFYVASGVNLAGRKGLLGLWLSEKT